MNKTKKIFLSIFTVILFFVLVLIFFYKLGEPALQSWDEAWYADITRNLLRTRNPLHLIFNGITFTDHPPLGYWLMAIPTALFGSNEFSARVISAFLGLLSAILVYLIGRQLKNWQTGIGALLILVSSMWFMLRVRSGNLDIPFVFWELVIFYGVIKLQERSSFIYVIAVGLALLFLTKTLIGICAFPLVFYGVLMNKNKISLKTSLKAVLLIMIIIIPWYLYNQIIDNSFLYHHFIEVGIRKNIYQLIAIKKSLFYLQIGIGKWFKLFVVSLIVGLLIFLKSKQSRYSLLLIILGLLGFGIPFIFSSKTEIWHLIPIYPFIALLISYSLQQGLSIILPKQHWFNLLGFFCILMISIYQFVQFSNLIYNKNVPISNEKNISLEAKKYHSKVYLMETFYPAAVYYSDQKVIPLYLDPKAYEIMRALLLVNDANIKSNTFIINKILQNTLLKENVNFKVLATSGSYLLIK